MYYLCKRKTELSFSKDSLAMGQVGVGDMRFIGELTIITKGSVLFFFGENNIKNK